MSYIYVLGLVFAVFGVAFAMINLRQLMTGKEFRGTCATNNPMLKNQVGDCTVCGKKPEEDCKMPDVEQNLRRSVNVQ